MAEIIIRRVFARDSVLPGLGRPGQAEEHPGEFGAALWRVYDFVRFLRYKHY